MISVRVVINSLEDAKEGKPIDPEAKLEDITECEELIVGILEGGMESGATSVMLSLRMPDGSVSMAQISAKQFHGIDGALKGAQERFGDQV